MSSIELPKLNLCCSVVFRAHIRSVLYGFIFLICRKLIWFEHKTSSHCDNRTRGKSRPWAHVRTPLGNVLNLWTISEEWVCCIPERGTGKHLWTGFVLPGLQKYSLYGDVCEMSNSAFDCNVPLVYVVLLSTVKKASKANRYIRVTYLLYSLLWSSCYIVSHRGRQMRCQYRNYDRKTEVAFCTHTKWEDGQNRPKLAPDVVPFCVVFVCII